MLSSCGSSARTSSTCGGALFASEYATPPEKWRIIEMSKRLTCLALCVLMLLSVFLTSCKKEEVVLDTTASAMTLTMLVITERQVYYTDEEYAALSETEKAEVDAVVAQYNAVEKAINKITKAKYRTALEIYYYTQEQYDEIVEEKLGNNELLAAERDSATKEYKKFQRAEKRNGVTDEALIYEKFVIEYPDLAKYITAPASATKETEEVEVEEEEEDILNEKYPEVDPNQVDILFIGSYEEYMDYIEKGWLSKLDDSLKSGVAKKLTTYVYPAFLSAAKTEKGYYAIPNNTIVGEYTTLLINKAMCDKYSDITQLSSLSDVLPLIKDVATYETGIDPVWADSYRGFTNVHFWSVDYAKNEEGINEFTIDPAKFSVIGASYSSEYQALSSNPSYFAFSNILNDTSFRSQLIALKTLEYNNYYGAAGSTNEFAVGILKGTGKDIDAYREKYYTVTLEYPVATEEDLFGSMYAVSAFTSDVARCMEILTLLNTDASFRNLFQYGIEGVNYEVTEAECAERTLENLYSMDIYKTGNMFVAYPDADRDMSQETWTAAMTQGREVRTNPTLGFSVVAEDLPLLSNIDVVNAASEEFWAAIEACTSIEDTVDASGKKVAGLESTVSNLAAQIEAGKYMKDIKQFALLPILDGDKDFSVAALYRLWCQKMGYVSAS